MRRDNEIDASLGFRLVGSFVVPKGRNIRGFVPALVCFSEYLIIWIRWCGSDVLVQA